MESILPYLIAGIAVMAVIVVLMVVFGKKSNSDDAKGSGAKKTKSQAQVVREAQRKLGKNLSDPEGLAMLGNVYFASQVWDKTIPIYEQLYKLSAVPGNNIDAFEPALKYGTCALKLEKYPEAVQALTTAAGKEPHSYEANYYLGQALYNVQQYDKAIPCLKKALILKPEAEGINFVLGQCYYMGHHYRDSLPCFKKALTENPSNKEALFDMADAMANEGHGDRAMKVFSHLRADPVYGARSCLAAGTQRMNLGDHNAAAHDHLASLRAGIRKPHKASVPGSRADLVCKLRAGLSGSRKRRDRLC